MISKRGITMLRATEVAFQLLSQWFVKIHPHDLLCGDIMVKGMVLAKYILASLFTRFTHSFGTIF
jgi:hypothetical protein